MMNMSDLVKSLNETVVVDDEKLVFNQIYRSLIAIVEASEKLEHGNWEIQMFEQVIAGPCQELSIKEPELIATVQGGGKNQQLAFEILFLTYRALASVSKRLELQENTKSYLQKAYDLLSNSGKDLFIPFGLDTLLVLVSVFASAFDQDDKVVNPVELKFILDTCDSLIEPLLAIHPKSLRKLLINFEGYEVLFGAIKKSYEEPVEILPKSVKNALVRDLYWYKKNYAQNIEQNPVKAVEYEVLHMKHLLYFSLPCSPDEVIAAGMELVKKCCAIKAVRQSYYLCQVLESFFDDYKFYMDDFILCIRSTINFALLTHYITLLELYIEAYTGPFNDIFIEFVEFGVHIHQKLGEYPCANESEATEMFLCSTGLITQIRDECPDFYNDFQVGVLKNKLMELGSRFAAENKTL